MLIFIVLLLLSFQMQFSSFDVPTTGAESTGALLGPGSGTVPLARVAAPPGTAGDPPTVYYPDFSSRDFRSRLDEGQCRHWEGLWPGVPRPARCNQITP